MGFSRCLVKRLSLAMAMLLTSLIVKDLPAQAQYYGADSTAGILQHQMMSPSFGSGVPNWQFNPVTPHDLGRPPSGYEHPIQIQDTGVEGQLMPSTSSSPETPGHFSDPED